MMTEGGFEAGGDGYTPQLLREGGMRTLVLVSDPFHLLRARQCFRQEGRDHVVMRLVLA